jgi:hypothetical protein
MSGCTGQNENAPEILLRRIARDYLRFGDIIALALLALGLAARHALVQSLLPGCSLLQQLMQAPGAE